jgi:hypothetical protein
MDGFTRNNPDPFSRGEAVAAQQPFSAGGPMVGDFYTVGEDNLPGEVRDLQPRDGLLLVASGKVSRDRVEEVHEGG